MAKKEEKIEEVTPRVNVLQHNISAEMRKSYLDYAMSVITTALFQTCVMV